MDKVAENIYNILIEKNESLKPYEKIVYEFPNLNMFGLDVSVLLIIGIDDGEKVNFYYKIIYLPLDISYTTKGIYRCAINEFMTTFCKSIDEFKLIKYSKTQGFYQEKKHFIDPVEFLFLETEQIKLKIQDCVVCYDKTKDKLHCSHYLCCHCHQKLKTEKCPMCRKCIQCDDDCTCDDE